MPRPRRTDRPDLDRDQRRQLQEALRKQDLKRRLKEAKLLIDEHRVK